MPRDLALRTLAERINSVQSSSGHEGLREAWAECGTSLFLHGGMAPAVSVWPAEVQTDRRVQASWPMLLPLLGPDHMATYHVLPAMRDSWFFCLEMTLRH